MSFKHGVYCDYCGFRLNKSDTVVDVSQSIMCSKDAYSGGVYSNWHFCNATELADYIREYGAIEFAPIVKKG